MSPFKSCLVSLLAGLGAVPAAAASYQRLYVFGDSYSDIGAGYVDGNGPTAVAYLAWNLWLAITRPQAPGADGESIDFAVSGALTGSGLGRRVEGALIGYGMMNQVEDFAALVKSGKIRFDPGTTLFFLAGGLNDRRLPSETTVGHLRREIEILKALGWRHFTVARLPTRIPQFSAVGRRLDPVLAKFVHDGRAEIGVDLWLNHWGADYDEVMEHPTAYGLLNTTSPCAGRAIFHQDPTHFGDPHTYFFYHDGHPSTHVHRIVGAMLADEVRARSGRAE